MTAIDVDKLLVEISPESPSGEDLEYDSAFGEFERTVQYKPEREIGKTKVAAEPPNWGAVESQAVELLGRTKDLRVALHLARARLNGGGLVGFAEGLALLRGLLERYWESLYPQLDASDDNDPTMRLNALTVLCSANSQSAREASELFLMELRRAPLVDTRGIGRFGYLDIEVARGERSPPTDSEQSPPNMATIDAAFRDGESEEIQAKFDAVNAGIDHVEAIESYIAEKVDATMAPDFTALGDLLKKVRDVFVEKSGVSGPGNSGQGQESAVAAAPAGGGTPAIANAPGGVGAIASPKDVVAALDRICDYYKAQEPSSPVPMLLQRAKRLVSRSFAEIIQDLAPESVKQIEKIGGTDSGKSSE